MQPRFERRSGNTPRALVEQPRYRAGYDFLRLRADAGEVDAELAEWWEDFALGDEDERVALLQAAREQQPPRRVRVGRRRAPSRRGIAGARTMPPPRKRRRRRRKPAGSEGADARAPDGPAPALPD